MKRPRLHLPVPCTWGLAALLAVSAGSARAVTLSLPGMAGIAPPSSGTKNLAVDGGGAGKGGGASAASSSAGNVAKAAASETSPEKPKSASSSDSSGGSKRKSPGSSGSAGKKKKPPVNKKPSGGGSTKKHRPEPEPEPEPEIQPNPPADMGTDTPLPALPPVSGKDTLSGKDLTPAVPAAADLRPTLFLTTGWSDKLYFRGLDILDRVSPDSSGSGALTARAKVVKGGWEFGAQYLQALDRQLPDRDAGKIEPNLLNPTTRLWDPTASQFENYRVPSRERYAELDLWASYTKNLGHDFSGTLGVTYYHFLDKQWWGLSSATEVQAGLNYSGFKWIEPSLLYAYDFNGFEGGYAELTVSAKNIPYWPLFGEQSGMQFSAVPFLKLSYDMGYNGEGNDWNHIEAGVNVPVVLNEHLALNLTASYNHSLSEWDDRETRPGTTIRNDRADDGWWFGLSLSTATKLGPFAGGGSSAGLPDYSGKDKVPMMAAPNHPWSVSGGMGLHSIQGDFRTGSQHPVSALNSAILTQRQSSDLGFPIAGTNKTYTYYDESGYSATPPTAAVQRSGTINSATLGTPGTVEGIRGTATFTGGQVSGFRADRNQQVRFLADEYSYSERFTPYDLSASDEDSVLFPYIRLDHELTKTASGKLSVGLMYSYTAAEMDSGTGLSSLASAIEKRTQHHYLFDVNELVDREARTDPAARLIFDADLMSTDPFFGSSQPARDFYALRDPQEAQIITELERNRLATFVASDLDVSMHSLAVPVSWEWDISDRAHLSLSAGASLNVFNAELDTEVSVRSLANTDALSLISNNTGGLRVRTGASLAGDFVEGNVTPGKTGGISSGDPGTVNTPSGGGTLVLPTGGFPDTDNLPRAGVQDVASVGSGAGAPGTGNNGGKGGNALAPRLPGTDVNTATTRLYENRFSEQDTRFQFGLFAQATLTYDLDQKDRWYLETWGRYDWIQSFNIGNGVTSANIDATSWAFGAGVGMRF